MVEKGISSYVILQLSNVLHSISNTDSVYRTSMENIIKVLDGIRQRMAHVEETAQTKTPIVDTNSIHHLNMSVEELGRKNQEISKSLAKTKYGLSQLGSQLEASRTQKVCPFRRNYNLFSFILILIE